MPKPITCFDWRTSITTPASVPTSWTTGEPSPAACWPECKRATPYDLEQFRKAVEAVKERITQAVERGQAKAANDSRFSG